MGSKKLPIEICVRATHEDTDMVSVRKPSTLRMVRCAPVQLVIERDTGLRANLGSAVVSKYIPSAVAGSATTR
jgi:hypothetical protein